MAVEVVLALILLVQTEARRVIKTQNLPVVELSGWIWLACMANLPMCSVLALHAKIKCTLVVNAVLKYLLGGYIFSE